VGEGGYQVGNFPPLWTEWNGQYRDTVRDFWRGEHATLGEFASRLTGSADLYASDNRRPIASVNFVTCHDGFTLTDLVSYDGKHNEANGEDNRDGADDNRSWNCGTEGPADDPGVLALRARQQRNLLTSLLLSQGVPMLLAGDELGRTQSGNNNSYCQDNELSWVHWPDEADGHSGASSSTSETEGAWPWQHAFVRALTQLRAQHPVFRRRRFLTGKPAEGDGSQPGGDQSGTGEPMPDIAWLTPDGAQMNGDDWAAGFAKSVMVFLNGEAITEPDQRGERVTDESFLLLFNAAEHDLDFIIPAERYGDRWAPELDTADPQPPPGDNRAVKAGDTITLTSRSLRLLRRE
jgi:isoamylase